MRAWQRARTLRDISARTPVRVGSVWSPRLKRFLELSVLRWHRVGKHVPYDGHRGRPRRNEWIAQDLFYLSGEKRTAKQIGSYFQMQHRWVGKNNGITWEEYILSKYASVSDSDLSDCGAWVDDEETPPPLIDDSGSTMCDSSGPATPLTMDYDGPAPQTVQDDAVRMDALVSRLAGLAVSRPPSQLDDGVARVAQNPGNGVGVAPPPVAHAPAFAPVLYVFDPAPIPVLNLHAPVVNVNVYVPLQHYLSTTHVGWRR